MGFQNAITPLLYVYVLIVDRSEAEVEERRKATQQVRSAGKKEAQPFYLRTHKTLTRIHDEIIINLA